jgi:hypothetical protein
VEQQYLAVHCRSDRAPTLTAHAILVLQPCYSYHPHDHTAVLVLLRARDACTEK